VRTVGVAAMIARSNKDQFVHVSARVLEYLYVCLDLFRTTVPYYGKGMTQNTGIGGAPQKRREGGKEKGKRKKKALKLRPIVLPSTENHCTAPAGWTNRYTG